jgi:hypothetical protein
MIYILGVNHCGQFSHEKNDSEKISQYIKQVKDICREKKITLIAEEMSEDSLLYNQIDSTYVGEIISELGVKYLLCDPGCTERAKLGLKQRYDVANELKLSIPLSEEDEDEVNKDVAVVESDRKREKYWLEQIKSKNGADKEVLLICGYEHSDSFADMAQKEGFNSKKIS